VSTDGQRRASDPGGMGRREMVAALARWTVPTVLTLSLATRAAVAAASCPPCTKKQLSAPYACKACTINAILSCNCEPCLGPPYCPSGSGVAPFRPTSGTGAPLTGRADLASALRRRRAGLEGDLAVPSPFGRTGRSLADSVFGGGARAPFGGVPGATSLEAQRLRSQAAARQGLYERLREFDSRRRP